MDPAAFDALLGGAPEAPVMTPPATPPAQPPAQPAAPTPPATPTVNGHALDASGQVGGAILTGAAKSLYETKDFIFGKTPESEKSDTRRSIESFDRELGEASIGNSFVSGLSQFATGMLGAGKLVGLAKAVPGVGGAVGALEATKAGSFALSSAKAATVGAVAFDPDGPRLSDLVVLKGPAWLQNPVSSYLAHSGNEDDTAALGRMKNALESIGMDAALAGVFTLSVKGYARVQAYRAGTGTAEEVKTATDELAHAVAHRDAKLAASKGDLETVEALRLEHPQAVNAAEQALEAHEATVAPAPVAIPEVGLPPEQAVIAPPTPPGLGPVPETNYRRRLSEHAPVVYHETNAEGLADWLPNDQSQQSGLAGKRERYYSNNPDLALGQDHNTGFRLELDTSGLEGRINQSKPTWRHSWEAGDAEFMARVEKETDDASLLRAVTVSPDQFEGKGTPWQRRARAKLEELSADQGWTRTANPDGSVTYRRPAADPGPVQPKDVGQQAAQATQSGDPAQAQVQRVDSPTQGAGPEGLPAKPRLLAITDDQVQRLIAHGQADTEQLLSPGGWEGALERGYKFGDGGGIPWQKLSIEPGTAPGTSQLDQVLRRVSDEFAGQIAAAKSGDGLGGVRSDALQDRLIQQRVAIYGDDPEALMGSLQLAGRNADRLVADVAAADLITLRASQDAQNLADRIRLGMLEEFGGDLSAAMSALRGHYQVAATARAESSAMVANAARTLRRQRAEFAYTPEDVAAMAKLSDAQMLNLIEAAGRDPRVADRLLRRGFWQRLGDDASYLYVNNLLWGLRTHFVNLSTNLYMLGARPLERMIGGAIQGDRVRVAANARQYAFMAGSLHEAWRDAVRTWQTGDSILSPHSSELSAATTGRSVNWVAEGFKQADSIPNVLSNAYTGFMKAAGLPTRALGAVDELVKQTVYRSKVMADAHGTGIAAGLEGPALSEHVRRALDAAFDDAGRAVDLKALDEAHIATFQQDLLPGTFGARVQGFVGDSAALRIIVPFIRTPTNVLRMGWKLTPGLNLAQKEYRLMLRGEMGPEAQAQAIGQMSMGSLFLGVAGLLTHAGFITGGGPSDLKLKQELMATGWQPYSFVVPDADGKPTYVNFGRFDPVAMPFGIMADVVDILERDHDGDGPGEKAAAALGGVFLSVVKQLGQKTYLTALNDTITAIVDPDRGLQKAAGKTAANFVPFASGLRFANPDPLMRETRGIVDSIMATVPGLSERLPAKRDLFGDPLTVHKGLWVTGKDGLVDAEVRRMIDEAGVGPFGPPSYRQRGVDLRDVTTADGRNAYEAFQELAGHPPRGPSLKETMGRLMATKAYQNAPDGEPGDHTTKGTKQAMLTGTAARYRELGLKLLMRDPNVRQAMFQASARGRAAVAARNAPKSDRQVGAAALERVGRGFGVDLRGVLTAE
ncbi:hypothetical protein LKMONMHP_2086 [Methylobacterium organophilum]|uniref:Large polyvalent protein associated domain-containing protein n=2 Tax=Methylobacterium organophilum TaxID=410 RepID=A0ABQ4T9D2_METOR|nr:hypothetical protein LKMONMHP_2086 [Methylobacterium organophilum]